jgi:hypothetical protein
MSRERPESELTHGAELVIIEGCCGDCGELREAPRRRRRHRGRVSFAARHSPALGQLAAS